MANRRRAVAASEAHAAEAALAALERGNAMDAVAAGVLAAAAATPSVLLGPVQILIGGAGAGLRAIDGRTRQPGLGTPRPRGFRDEDPIAPASRVAVPALPAAIALALATAGAGSLARALGPAVDIARGASEARMTVLKRLAKNGVGALAEGRIADELVAAAGRVVGGLLSVDDLTRARPAVTACAESAGPRTMATAPWGASAVRDPVTDAANGSIVEVVAACDARGLVAIACYEVSLDGVAIVELGLVAPFAAAPVRRGEPRVRPGEPRAAAAPIALRVSQGVVDLALGIARAASAERQLGAVLAALHGDATLEQAMAARTEGRLAGVACSRDAARAVLGG
jgi:hypothetical protein